MSSDRLCHKRSTYLHVSDVAGSVAFYRLLGLEPDRIVEDAHGRCVWALLLGPQSRLMLGRADAPIDASVQAAMLYLYASDVVSLREHLLEQGIPDGGRYLGGAVKCATGADDWRMIFEPARPPWMPDGELRVHDPDGYVLLIGQHA